jgi:ADP-ribosyl-[dinitrogen reductase] hydrolase
MEGIARVERDRVRGMLLGVAIGDAIGLPFEFNYKKQPYSDLIQYKAYNNSQFHGKRYYAIGQYSDDMELTITLARNLIKNKKYNRDKILLDYMEWANTNPPMGNNTRNLFQNVKTIRGYESRFSKYFPTKESQENSQSNGCLMRCSSLACLWNNDDILLDTALTNPSEVSKGATLFYTYLLRCILTGDTKKHCWENAVEILPSLHPEINRIVKMVESGTEWALVEFKGRKRAIGWVLYALYAGLYCYYHFVDDDSDATVFEKSLAWVIKDHPDSDTDTNAAVAGGLIGAAIGSVRMEASPITAENIRLVMSHQTRETDRPRPVSYHLSDLEAIVDGLTYLSGL